MKDDHSLDYQDLLISKDPHSVISTLQVKYKKIKFELLLKAAKRTHTFFLDGPNYTS